MHPVTRPQIPPRYILYSAVTHNINICWDKLANKHAIYTSQVVGLWEVTWEGESTLPLVDVSVGKWG
jgi:hypothetical protein